MNEIDLPANRLLELEAELARLDALPLLSLTDAARRDAILRELDQLEYSACMEDLR